LTAAIMVNSMTINDTDIDVVVVYSFVLLLLLLLLEHECRKWYTENTGE